MTTNTFSKPNNPACGDGKSCATCQLKYWCEKSADSSDIKIELPEKEYTPWAAEYQLAIDIGTTTVAAALVADNKIVATAGKINPQVKWGTDVLTRAEAAMKEGEKLRKAIYETIAEIANALCPENVPVTKGVITGNTTMLYLMTGRNPECLTKAPFDPDWLGNEEIEIAGIQFYIPPCISAFIGADAVCAVISTGMEEQTATVLLADIGTNGEILLWHESKLWCTSAAAGPAFEGFGLSHGMGASEGAVEHVYIAGDKLTYKVIGNKEPQGLCGSGIIDLIACLKQTGVLEVNGTLNENHSLINGNDVHMIQLAKAAVCAGIMTVMEKVDVKPNQIETFYIAGGFGKNLNIQNAAHIRLFPLGLSKKAKVTGNSALKGAAMLCSNRDLKDKCKNLCQKAEVIKLTEEEAFAKKFIECMAIKPII